MIAHDTMLLGVVLLSFAFFSGECSEPQRLAGRQPLSWSSSLASSLAFASNLPSRPVSRRFSSRNSDVTQSSASLLFSPVCRSRFGFLAPHPNRVLQKSNLCLELNLFMTNRSGDDGEDEETKEYPPTPKVDKTDSNTPRGARVKNLAKKLLSKPLQVVPMPQAIAAVLREATYAAVEEVEVNLEAGRWSEPGSRESVLKNTKEMVTNLVEDAFAPIELQLKELENTLKATKVAVEGAKLESIDAIEAIQVAAIAQAEGAATAVAQAEKVAELQVMKDIYANAVSDADVSDLSFDDVDFDSSEMAPPFLDPDSCLIPGEPVIRVEKAPENSRRIFAGIDIVASVDDVWNILTQYDKLQEVVPNLVVNEVMDLYVGKDLATATYDTLAPPEVQCKQLADQMKGALLKQVGGAKVAGINFSARTTLEVREWPQGMPDFAHFTDDMWEGISRDTRAQENEKVKLTRYRFPRPFALSSLPTRDISMQSIQNDDGEFRMYQGVWRMQPLPGCASPGQNAMRLSYAVEISPKAYLPVQLVEGRIVRDLCANLEAIRNFVGAKTEA